MEKKYYKEHSDNYSVLLVMSLTSEVPNSGTPSITSIVCLNLYQLCPTMVDFFRPVSQLHTREGPQ